MDALTAMVTERPYVLAFLAAFLVISSAERGWRRTFFWLVSGTLLGWLMEFSSIRTGFPFGSYTYHEANFPDELWLGGVPFFASLSFAFLTYFGYSIARTFFSVLERRGNDLRRQSNPLLDGSLRVLLLPALITTWADTIIDPVSHLGEYWFLGDLYTYQGDGLHFDVPISNYAGWFFTTAIIVFVNQRFDQWLRSRSAVGPQGYHLPLKPFWAVGSFLGNSAFMLGVTIYLIASDGVPSAVPAEQILASGLVLSGLFATFATAMIWRGLARKTRSELARTWSASA